MTSPRATASSAIADDEKRWLARQTNSFIAAVRQGEIETVYRLADEAAARTLAAGPIFQQAAELAASREDWETAVRFAMLDHAGRPDHVPARATVIRLLLRLGRRDIAATILGSARAAQPDAPDILRLGIEIALDDPQADVDAVVAATLAGRHASFTEQVVQMLVNAGRFASAARALDRAIAEHGPTPGLRRQAATLAYRQGLHDEADRRWRELGADVPEMRGAATLFRARIAVGRDAREAAERLYAEALEADPANVEAARYLVRVRIARGALAEAGAALASHRDAVGESATTAWLDALLLVANGQGEAAAAAGALALSRYPDDADLALRIADMRSDGGDWIAAAAIIDQGLARAPTDFALLVRRIRAAEALGAPPAEISTLVERALAQRPADEGMLRSRANLLVRLGRRREAVAVAIAALDYHPRALAFWRIAVANLLNLGEPVEAQALVERARALFAGEAADDLLALSEILETADALDEAVATAERALAADPDLSATYLTLARQLVALGRYRQAEPYLTALQERADRPSAGASMFARVARAIAYVDAHPLPDEPGERFPDAIFARVAASAVPRSWASAEPLVFHVTGSLGAGGAERQVALTVRGQQARAAAALRPVLLAQDLNPLLGRDFFLGAVESAGIEVAELSRERSAGHVRDFVAANSDRRGDVSLLAALPPDVAAVALPLFCLLAERRPRVVHLWQDAIAIAGGIAAMLAGTPRIVIGTRSTHPVERQRLRPWLAAGYRALRRYPGTAFINNSVNGARDYAEWLDWPPSTFATIHNGFDVAAIRATADPARAGAIRASLGAGAGSVLFGGVMRLSFEKRPELWVAVAIELARAVPGLRAVLVGEGPMREPLLAMVERAGLADRITLVGRQSPVEPWMAAMDMLFLSSLTEGLPNVLVEAQALGIPVATMRVGGAPETVLENETATIVDEGSAGEIAGKLLPLATDAAMRGRYGRAAAAWTEASFSDHSMLDRFERLYRTGEG